MADFLKPKPEWTASQLLQNAEINKHKHLLERLIVEITNLQGGQGHPLRALLKDLLELVAK